MMVTEEAATTSQSLPQQQQQQQQQQEEHHQQKKKNHQPHHPEQQKQQRQLLQALLSTEPCTRTNPWLVELLLSSSTSSKTTATTSTIARNSALATRSNSNNHNSNNHRLNSVLLLLPATISKFSRTQVSTFFTTLRELVMEYHVIPNQNNLSDEDGHEEDNSDDIAMEMDDILFGVQVLHAAAIAVQALVDGLVASLRSKQQQQQQQQQRNLSGQQRTQPKQHPLALLEEVIDLTILLHDQLFQLQRLQQEYNDHHAGNHLAVAAKRAQDAILHLCETCWQANVVHREQLTVQVLPILLTLSLSPWTNPSSSSQQQLQGKQLLHRIWQMRDAMAEIDFQHPSTLYLRSILLKTVSHPLWLKLPEGRRFLAFLLSSKHVDNDSHHTTDEPVDDDVNDFNQNSDDVVVVAATTTTSFKQDLHDAIRMQIPHANQTILQAYADIYHRAWKDAVSVGDDEDTMCKRAETKRTIGFNDTDGEDNIDGLVSSALSPQQWLERYVLQDLVCALVHVQSSTLHQSLYVVLDPFLASSKTPMVAALWYRLCSPILWRALASIHPQVRCQAMGLLAKVFPLTPPIDCHATASAKKKPNHASAANAKAAMDKALQTMDAMMLDDTPSVRVATNQAVAQVLATFWDVIPTQAIRSLLHHLVMEHASDGSSALVRAGALQAVTILLQAPESHAVLRTLLPHMGNLIHDRAARVRLACVKMLMSLQQLQHVASKIKFYHVVPVHHLTARLGHEQPRSAVASALTLLLLPSYLPSNANGSNQVQRTLVFLSRDPVAALAFYAHVAQHVPVSTVTKLIVMLWKCLVAAVEAATAANDNDEIAKSDDDDLDVRRNESMEASIDHESKGGNDSNNDSTTTSSSEPTNNTSLLLNAATNRPLMAHMAETISTLWSSIEPALCNKPTQYQLCVDFLVESFSGSSMTSVLDYFEQQAAKLSPRRNDDEYNNDNSRNDGDDRMYCYQVCEALLQCAARLTPTVVPCLTPHIVSRWVSLSNVVVQFLSNPTGGSSVQEKSGDYLTCQVALFCAWGYVDPVADCLASSLLQVLDRGGDNDADDIAPAPLLPATKKRGRRVNHPAPKKADGDEDARGSLTQLPTMDALAACHVLDQILRGTNTATAKTRNLLFASPTAAATLEQALRRSLKCAERLIKADVGFGSGASDAEIEILVWACYAFGRFALHRHEATDGGVGVKLDIQAHQILEWTTDRIVPALKWSSAKLVGNQSAGGEVTPFPDLDLSRISTASSSMSLSFSPSPQPPPRQRVNRNFTPKRLDASFESPDAIGGVSACRPQNRKSGTLLTQSSVLTASAGTAAMFASLCILFSEWLALAAGVREKGAGADGNETVDDMEVIAKSVMKWFDILFMPAAAPCAVYAPEVWMGLTKICVQLCKVTHQFQPIRQLLIKCRSTAVNEANEIGLIIQNSIVLLLNSRDAAVTAGVVDCVLEAALDLSTNHAIVQEVCVKDGEDNMPLTISDLFGAETDAGQGSVPDALLVISANKNACMLLVERLISICEDDQEKSNDPNKLRHAAFAAKCLLWLCHETSSARCSLATKHKIQSELRTRNVMVQALPANHPMRLSLVQALDGTMG